MQTTTQTLLASQQLWLIPILPFLGFLVNGLFGRRLSKPVISIIACGSVLLSFLWVLKTIASLGAPDTAHVEH
jgi:NADH-quinone oxidoreductase subunit L